jgi:hypothetical protein
MAAASATGRAAEWAARRLALAQTLPPGALAVVPGHPNRFLSQAIPSVPLRLRVHAWVLG